METLSFQAVGGIVQQLLPTILLAVKADWYKIISEGLRVLNAIVMNFPLPSSNEEAEGTKMFMREIFLAIMPRLEALDIDQEIKVSTMSHIICLILYLHSMTLGGGYLVSWESAL